MATPALQSPSPTHPTAPERPDLARLQRRIQRLERNHRAAGVLPTGAAALDAVLPGGGLARGALHELVAAPLPGAAGRGPAAGASEAAVAGFTAALLARVEGPVLWCRSGPQFYLPGLVQLGLAARHLVVVRGRDDVELLWAMEEALRSGAVAAVAGEVREPTPLALRRLQLAAEDGGSLGLLLRPQTARKIGGPAATRWRLSPLPGAGEETGGSGAARWRAELTRVRGGRPGTWAVTYRDGGFDAAPLAAPDPLPEQETPEDDGNRVAAPDRLAFAAPLRDRPRRAAG